MSDRTKGRPVAVAEALRAYLDRAGLTRRLSQAQVIPDWVALVGPQIAAVTTPERVTPDGTLFVRVATSAWMNELQLMAPDILARINRGPGPGAIAAIRWLLSQ